MKLYNINERKRKVSRNTFKKDNFICQNCGMPVSNFAYGTHNRNHCPHCLFSIHVDIKVGDRANFCKGKMEPIAIWVRNDGEWALVHRCITCGVVKVNRIAGDDNEQLLSLITKRPFEKT